MNENIAKMTADVDSITVSAQEAFGGLSSEQLNWKPSAKSWSVGQCVDHLIRSNVGVFPALDGVIAGKKPTFWERYSPFTSWIGGFMIRSLSSDARKFKAPTKAIVPPSDIAADIVDQFAANQALVVEKIKALNDIDGDKVVLTSPFMRLMTYKVSDGFRILVEHEKRHIRQGKRVMEMDGFPK